MTHLDIEKLKKEKPEITLLADAKELCWINPKNGEKAIYPFTSQDIEDAQIRLERFAGYIAKAFPETAERGGIIESPLIPIPKMKGALEKQYETRIPGRLLLKCDSHLPVSGSIKARGGIYEVLKFAEKVALENNMLKKGDDYSILMNEDFKAFFSRYSVAVGSTGNLGLSIGIISAKLGFRVTIHMSQDARQWKKDLLRSKGAAVVEYPDDYQKAVAEGRKEAASDPACHFVDDEGSGDLFLGYATAAKRLEKQLKELDIAVDQKHPLFVYLPCGVGGGPGGVTFGLKDIFGEHVHCFFAEPTQAPCMALGMITGLHDGISCRDIELDGVTEADGLAVGRASRLVGTIMESQLDGIFTVDDNELFRLLWHLADTEAIRVEPSACAGFPGPVKVLGAADYLQKKGLLEHLDQAAHILWATGGSMVPETDMQSYLEKGRSLL